MGLPPRIVEAVALHHEPAQVLYGSLCALTAVHAAAVLSLRAAHRATDGKPAWNIEGRLNLDQRYLEQVGVVERLSAWSNIAERFFEDVVTVPA